jgi:hypothetical protein
MTTSTSSTGTGLQPEPADDGIADCVRVRSTSWPACEQALPWCIRRRAATRLEEDRLPQVQLPKASRDAVREQNVSLTLASALPTASVVARVDDDHRAWHPADASSSARPRGSCSTPVRAGARLPDPHVVTSAGACGDGDPLCAALALASWRACPVGEGTEGA